MKLKEIELDLKLVKLKFTKEELDKTLSQLFEEMKIMVSRLSSYERNKLKQILAKPSMYYEVKEIFPEFLRESGNIDFSTLRKLRDAQFIRPHDRGKWRGHKKIEIKAFGKIIWDKLGEDLFQSK